MVCLHARVSVVGRRAQNAPAPGDVNSGRREVRMNQRQQIFGRLFVAMALVLLCWAPQLVAAEGFELQQFHPMPDQHENFFSAASADVPGHLVWSGWLVMNYGNSPLVLRDADGERLDKVVGHQHTGHFLFSLGLTERLELGLDLPVVLFQRGSGAADLPDVNISPEEGGFGLADVRWMAKGQLFSTRDDDHSDGVALALMTDMYLPTGNGERLQGGDFRVGPRLVFDAVVGGVKMGANLGYLYRSQTQVANLDVRDTLDWKAGLEVPVSERFRATGEVFGRVTPGADEMSSVESPAEFLLGGKFQRDALFLVGGGGTGLVNGYGAPDWRMFFGAGWSPARVAPPPPEPEPEPECRQATVDTDCGEPPPAQCMDGVITSFAMACEDGECVTVETETACEADEECGEVDGEPACVPKPECRADSDCTDVPPSVCEAGLLTTYAGMCVDGECVYESTDRICEENEECGTVDGEPACVPGPERVEVEEERIEITEMIHFALDSDEIERRSYDILNEVARVLQENPHIELVRIEGHTDNIGARAYNVNLSQRRAESVRRYLIDQGVDADRLSAVGKGPDEPIADNATDEGRHQNRRVEFHIEQRAE